MRSEVLRTRNGIDLVINYNDDGVAYSYSVHEKDDIIKTYFIHGDKEYAYLCALSAYLYAANVIQDTYLGLSQKLVAQEAMPYNRLVAISRIALKKLKESDLLEEIDMELDDEDKEFFGISDLVLLKTYKITRMESINVTIAVEQNESECEIERRLEEYADNEASDYGWDFEEYDIDERDCEERDKQYAKDYADIDMLND